MTVGLSLIYLVLAHADAHLSGWTLTAPLLVYGFGMGMIFVPLFDIIMGDIRDHQVGSASGILESLQQLGSSLGVAVLGTVFFSVVAARPNVDSFLAASQRVALLALGLTAVAFVLGFLLPSKQRTAAASTAGPAGAPARDEELVAA
jgi:hypothetical protein